MEEQETSFGIANNLGYDEIARLQKGDRILENRLVKDLKHELLHKLMDNTPNCAKLKKAFCMEIELLDGMNLVGKITEIPVQEVVYQPKTIGLTGQQLYQGKKLSLLERLKIFVKGEL